MSGRYGRDFAHSLDSGSDGERGPTWADVRWLAREMEQEFGCKVSFRFGAQHLTERWSSPMIWVRASAYSFLDDATAHEWAGVQMGGNGGSKSMPGACVHALLELAEVCVNRQPRLPETDV